MVLRFYGVPINFVALQAALGLARLAAEPSFQETLVDRGVLAPLLSLASQSLFETMQVFSSPPSLTPPKSTNLNLSGECCVLAPLLSLAAQSLFEIMQVLLAPACPSHLF